MAFPKHPLDVLVRKLNSISHLSDEEKQAVHELPVTVRLLSSHQDIVREKDTPTQCCLVLEGWICRYQLLSEGKRQIFSFHIPGDMPDLQSLHLKVLDHNIGTLTSATVAFIPHKELRDLMLRYPRMGAVFWRDTLVDASVFRLWMTGMGRRTALQAVAHLFCELYFKLQAVGLARDHIFQLPVTQQDLGDALGLSNVHVNRVLREMRDGALVRIQSRGLEILNWQELSKLCEFDPSYLHLERRDVG